MDESNILILIHGMTTVRGPWSHHGDYAALWDGLIAQEPALATAFVDRVQVEWGHRPPDIPFVELRDDQLISDAEQTLFERISYETVKEDLSPQNHLLANWNEAFSKMVTRHVTDPIKEKIAVFGLTDLLYYASADGEGAIRAAAYHQILEAVRIHEAATSLQLHLIGHGLGAVIAHDFLFGLFADGDELTRGQSGFLENEKATNEDRERYARLRARALSGTLSLGSFAATACQIPLMMMRKQSLVNRLADGAHFDPRAIGVPLEGPVKWRIFYDVDDVLAFPTRRLYGPTTAIEEFQVNTDWRPDLTHAEYWNHPVVLARIADLLALNLN